MNKLLLAVLALIITVTAADARPRKHHSNHHRTVAAKVCTNPFGYKYPCNFQFNTASTRTEFTGRGGRHAARPAGCPSRWCGCWMRKQAMVDPGREFDVAANWIRKRQRISHPVPGAAAVWRNMHHVGIVRSVEGNNVCVESGNSGGATGVNTVCLPRNRFAGFSL